MPIVMRLDRVMADRKMSSTTLARLIGTSTVNLSHIKTGKIKGMRFSTLAAICDVLDCKPGDIIDYVPNEEDATRYISGNIPRQGYHRDANS